MISRRSALAGLGAAGAVATLAPTRTVRAQPAPIRIGWAVSRTGPFAGGAATTVIPNYEMWAREVNEQGGIRVGNARRPIQVVEYDDRSNSEEAVRAVERLISQDRVDFILPPWGTGLNLAVGALLNRAGHLHLAVNSVTNRVDDLGRRWTNAFWFLGRSSSGAEALVAQLAAMRQAGQITPRVAMAAVSDQFGVELANAGRAAFRAAGFDLVMDRNYPLGTTDFAPIVNEAARANPDAFVAFSYPPDTIAITDQARVLGFNPKVFYTAVGTAFPLFRDRFGANAEGVMGIGGWHADSPALRDYMRRHIAFANREPDRWASSVTYASLEVLAQAIERAGTIDRAAVIAEVAKGGFDTIAGRTEFAEDRVRRGTWWVGQWQGGEFHGIAPANLPGARAAAFPKPAWRG